MEPCDVTVSPEGKQNGFWHEAQEPGHMPFTLVFWVLETWKQMSYLAWAQAVCPRTGNSSDLPPPWFWQDLGLQRTVQWPFGSPVAYQLAMNSPVWTGKRSSFSTKREIQSKSTEKLKRVNSPNKWLYSTQIELVQVVKYAVCNQLSAALWVST